MATARDTTKVLDLSISDGVAILTLDRVEQRNALTPDFAQSILDRIELVNGDESVGALVITGSGPAFCAGGDLSWIRAAALAPISSEAVREFDVVYSVFAALTQARVPTIAAAGGATVGAGINLAAACDVRIVGDDFIARGFSGAHIHPGGGHLALLRRCVGSQMAAAIMFFGKELDATEAVSSGFALESVQRAKLVPRAVELATSATEDIALTRRVTATLRALEGIDTPVATAVLLERMGQIWSLQRLGQT